MQVFEPDHTIKWRAQQEHLDDGPFSHFHISHLSTLCCFILLNFSF